MRMKRKHLYAAADYRFCPCRILHNVPPYRKQILWQDCLSACQGEDIPAIPSAFTASFYSGLGPMLLLASFRFVANMETHR